MFDGHIPFTPIVVDDFSAAPVLAQPGTPLAFFLTHYHKDHLRGLSPTFARGPIYATKVTRALLLVDLPALRPRLRTVELEEKAAIELDGGGYTFHVTAFDANHCPGAAILLFQLPAAPSSPCPPRLLLHTGDMRYDPLRFHSPLLLSAVNRIDTLYLDCTFFHPTAAVFPSKAESVRLLTRLVAAYFRAHSVQYGACKQAAYFHPLQHPRVYVAADMLGTEELLIALHAHFGHRMYVAKEWGRWRQLALLKRTLPLLTSEQWSTPFTVCAARQFQHFKAEMDGKRQQADGLPALYIKPSSMWFVRLSEQRRGGKMQSTAALQRPKPEATQLGGTAEDEIDVEAVWDEAVCEDSEWVARDSCGVVHVLWSMHSAMSECLHFIQLLQPRFIVPLNPPAALSSLAQHASDEPTAIPSLEADTTATSSSGAATLTRKRRNSSIRSTSQAERDRAVVTSLQRYIDSVLPNKRIQVRSPVTAAEAEAAADSQSRPLPRVQPSADSVPDTPPRLQGLQRLHSSPCRLASGGEATVAVQAGGAKAEVDDGGGGGGAVAGRKLEAGLGSQVNRSLFAVPGVVRAHSTLLAVREDIDRTLVWHGAAGAVAAAAAVTATAQNVKQEKVVDVMPALTKE